MPSEPVCIGKAYADGEYMRMYELCMLFRCRWRLRTSLQRQDLHHPHVQNERGAIKQTNLTSPAPRSGPGGQAGARLPRCGSARHRPAAQRLPGANRQQPGSALQPCRPTLSPTQRRSSRLANRGQAVHCVNDGPPEAGMVQQEGGDVAARHKAHLCGTGQGKGWAVV